MKFNVVKILNDIESLFFPDACLACFNSLVYNEKIICVSCRHQLPLTNYHLYNDNPVEKVFHGRINIENATALLSYRGSGTVKNLIHYLKYKGYEEIGELLGKMMGFELSKTSSFSGINMVLPVPLHPKRLKKRGYNQVALFGKQIALALEASYDDTIIYRKVNSETQTFKNRLMRWQHKEHVFEARETELLANRHILLVDDVVTTGATIEACAYALRDVPNLKISIATMAITE